MSNLWWRLVHLGFHLLYYEFAWTYDLVSYSVSLGHWRCWQKVAIPYLEAGDGGDKVLELAHGTGNLQVDMAPQGISSVGVDLSPFMGRIAHRKLIQNRIAHSLVRANAMCMPFSSEIFSGVVSTFPTEFIMHPSTIREIHRVLKPGGRFVCVLGGGLTLINPLVRCIEWLYQITGQKYAWTEDRWKEFRVIGFNVETVVERLPNSQAWIIIANKLLDCE